MKYKIIVILFAGDEARAQYTRTVDLPFLPAIGMSLSFCNKTKRHTANACIDSEISAKVDGVEWVEHLSTIYVYLEDVKFKWESFGEMDKWATGCGFKTKKKFK